VPTKTDTHEMPAELALVPILVDIHVKAREVDDAKAHLAALVRQCNELVLEAVDNGEPYRDISTAAGRSLGWVQTALEAIGAEGPRVRRRPARIKAKETKSKTKSQANAKK
jgi:hypothetical protein